VATGVAAGMATGVATGAAGVGGVAGLATGVGTGVTIGVETGAIVVGGVAGLATGVGTGVAIEEETGAAEVIGAGAATEVVAVTVAGVAALAGLDLGVNAGKGGFEAEPVAVVATGAGVGTGAGDFTPLVLGDLFAGGVNVLDDRTVVAGRTTGVGSPSGSGESVPDLSSLVGVGLEPLELLRSRAIPVERRVKGATVGVADNTSVFESEKNSG
jgi:hypothetical protein